MSLVLNCLISWLVLSVSLTPQAVAGVVLVIAGTWLYSVGSRSMASEAAYSPLPQNSDQGTADYQGGGKESRQFVAAGESDGEVEMGDRLGATGGWLGRGGAGSVTPSKGECGDHSGLQSPSENGGGGGAISRAHLEVGDDVSPQVYGTG
eukprot:CAMPEP_0180647600 /NCGR_PEP_ID=MMETSP1037_2-20121125/50428_1 /TAXON_ID=632150 /ORGANISM="Azadinium spinosum, Strain 3D9" /LENGTH=149 /DNA_ID=CAMNT_0022672173 /DNA_START=14 /DNA_END=459 /DNA_ORIENTATION=-